MWGLFASISIFWILIHLFNRKHQESIRSLSSSPNHSPFFNFSTTTFVAKLETSRFNRLPFIFLKSIGIPTDSNNQIPLSSRRRTERDGGNQIKKKLLSIFYSTGTYFAFGASLASIVIILIGLFQLINDLRSISSINSVIEQEEEAGTQKLFRRSEIFPTSSSSSFPSNSNLFQPTITPLIPGVTLPLWHLPFMILSLFISQIIHESGHALAAALNGLKPLRIGVLMVFPILPGAFVVLPEEAFDNPEEKTEPSVRSASISSGSRHDDLQPNERRKLLDSDSQLRILAAGVWHNFVSFALMSLFLSIRVGRLWKELLWEEARGMNVLNVDSLSPLSSYLKIGDTITHLDDLSIDVDSETERKRIWNHFLLEETFIPGIQSSNGSVTSSPHWSIEQESLEELGWCVDRKAWEALPNSCCNDPTKSKSSNTSDVEFCFTSSGTESSQRCLDPLPFIINSQQQESNQTFRCIETCESSSSSSNSTSTSTSLCVRPDPREELVRIGILDRESKHSMSIPKLVLFQGSRKAIHKALNVSPIIQRFWFFPIFFSEWFELITDYFLTLSLALALLNMLPLPHLDGDAFLTIAARKIFSWKRTRSSSSSIGMQRLKEDAGRGTRDVAGRFVEVGGYGNGNGTGTGNDADEVWIMKMRRRVHWSVGILSITVLCGSTLLHLALMQ